MGRKDVAARALRWLHENGFDIAAVLTDSHLSGSPTTAVARSLGLRVMSLEEAREEIRTGELYFDLGVSVVYWRIIPDDVIEAATLGVINFHPAPLPDYKGTAGYNVAILEGLDTWGVTAHYVDAGIDTGPIIEVDRFSIDVQRETAQSLEATSMMRMSEQFARIISATRARGARLETTPNEGGTYISRDEMEQMKVISPGDDLDRKIRAFWFPPYSGATVFVDGAPYTLVNQQILEAIAAGAGGASTSLLSPVADG